jgi:DNA repair protein RadC
MNTNKSRQPMMNIYASESAGKKFPSAIDGALLFRENAADLDDSSILAEILSNAAIKNREELAETLLDAFGSFKGVIEARPEQLRTVPGITEKAAKLIASYLPVANAWRRRLNIVPERINNAREAELYCQSLLSGSRTEKFFVVCLNAQCQVIGKRKISDGSLSEVSCYPRVVMETALNYNAHSVLLSHNHPGGTCAPSPEDIASTLKLQQLLNGVSVIVLDHIIVANDNTYSMIQHGDIDYRTRKS